MPDYSAVMREAHEKALLKEAGRLQSVFERRQELHELAKECDLLLDGRRKAAKAAKSQTVGVA